MKNIKIFAFLVVALFGVLLMSAAFDDAGSGVLYRYDFRTELDTITDTGATTFTIPAALHSKWAYNWDFEASELTGTTDLTCVIQEQAVGDGPWTQVGTIDLDGDSSGRVVGATVYGLKQRCICTGTGTQSTQIDVYAVFKKD